MKLTHILLAMGAMIACGAIGARASTNPSDDLAFDGSNPLLAQLAQAEPFAEQFALAQADRPRDDEEDEDEAEEARSDRRDEAGDRDEADRPPRADGRRWPADVEQMRDLFQRMRRARAAGNEEEAADLMRQVSERIGDMAGPPFGPGPGGRGPGMGQRGREGMGPPADRGPGGPGGRGLGPRGNRPDQPPQAGPDEPTRGDRPAEARRGPGPGPREGWNRPDRPSRAGQSAARRGGQRGRGGPNAPGQGRRAGQQWRRPGPQGPWGGGPAWQGPGAFRGPATGQPGFGPRPGGPGLELRQLREEMQELRKAIEALTKEVEAARQAK